MNIRQFAETLIASDDLDIKLEPPPRELDDDERGPAVRIAAPGRPANLGISGARRFKVPPIAGMTDPAQRGRILHALANHELQAAELFAWALLAFPDMPDSFRRGLLGILADEQRHCRLYLRCMDDLGVAFGDYPVTGHFWNKLEAVQTPLQFVCTMGLTFENANLDFAVDYARKAREVGEVRMARAIEVVHADEIRHVGFAWRWLHELKSPDDGAWEAYCKSVSWPLGPERARGKSFDVAGRIAAGLDPEFIEKLEHIVPKRPSGAPR